MTHHISLPHDILPHDGRFGSGPSKIRSEQMEALVQANPTVLGTSHRQAPVRDVVASIKDGLTDFFSLPEGYEVMFGNGGASAFWDIACACLIENTAAFGVFGEFGGKFAAEVHDAPFLADPVIFRADYGTTIVPSLTQDADVYAWPHNETSTGAATTITPVAGSEEAGALTIIDGTSAAGGLPVDISQTDVYYFSPQKAFGSDGGLWIAIVSPAAIARAEKIEKEAAASGRWIPTFLSFGTALRNSRKNQTYNTPAVATLVLMNEQIEWLNRNGGLDWSTKRCEKSASILYSWAEESEFATPFVADPQDRSHVVVSLDINESLAASDIVAGLRENGIVDTFAYRKLNRNQLRVGVFPSVEPEDVRALTECIDLTVDQLKK